MKKLFAIVLTVAMVLSMSVSTFATTIDNTAEDRTANVTVTYTAVDDEGNDVEEAWTVTIPATATAGGAAQNITASGTFSPAKTLKVTAPANVTLYIDGDNRKDNAVLDVTFAGIALAGSYTDAVDATVEFSVAAMNNIKFGSWSGTLTFTVAMEDVANYTASNVLANN